MPPLATVQPATRHHQITILSRGTDTWYVLEMLDLHDIERAVEALSPEDYDSFRNWLERFEAARFDTSIARDAEAGRLDRVADEALAELDSGRTRPL